MLEIDGSFGEGGGQILRTSLSLSCMLHMPFRMVNIRKRRRKPGLMPQHLACIQALAHISQAKIEGASINSTEITFAPRGIIEGDYLFDIGTAGSTSLLLQALLPPLLFSSRRRSTITLLGGTHVPFSPTFDYIREIFLHALRALGIRLHVSLERYGFYPKGGGRIRADIPPAGDVRPMKVEERGGFNQISVISGVADLPLSIAARQSEAALRLLKKSDLHAESEEVSVQAYGKGTFVFLQSEAEQAVAGFSSLGAVGKKAEQVGEEAAGEFLKYAASGAGIDPHLADQLILYLSCIPGESSFTTSRITDHLLTNLLITEQFTGVTYSVQGPAGMPGKVRISGKDLSFQLDSPKTDP
jgi:RNA 3'-terminal phosphate cyclase (ATP)